MSAQKRVEMLTNNQAADPVFFELCPGRRIGPAHPAFVIAEIGQNHQGSLGLAKQLILAAKSAGADCVKMQKSTLGDKFTQRVLSRPYACAASWGETYGKHKEHLEMSSEEYFELKRYSDEVGIFFTASAMDNSSADFLVGLGVPFVKVGSGDSNNVLLLEKLAKMKDVNLVISTGMSDMESVRSICTLMKTHRGDRPNVALLQCTSSYPTPFPDVNLNVIGEYMTLFPEFVIGYSGHENGFIPTVGACAMGARVVERHITLDKGMKGSDHCCSLDLAEFAEMVRALRVLEASMGMREKRFLECEMPCFEKLGKSVVAARDLGEGTVLRQEDVCVKVATPRGLDPNKLRLHFGKILNRDVLADDPITEDMLE